MFWWGKGELKWALDIREGNRVSTKGLSFGAMFPPMVKSLGEGSNVGQKLGCVQATLSKGNGTGMS